MQDRSAGGDESRAAGRAAQPGTTTSCGGVGPWLDPVQVINLWRSVKRSLAQVAAAAPQKPAASEPARPKPLDRRQAALSPGES